MRGMRIPRAAFGVLKEVLRHLLRRPVVGLVAVARVPDGRLLLIRRADTGGWALPGGTLEWGETLRSTLPRELAEEAGVTVLSPGELLGVYSSPDRDPRFHAVTVVVAAEVSMPGPPPQNPLEILEVGLFAPDAVPPLSHGFDDVVKAALAKRPVWE